MRLGSFVVSLRWGRDEREREDVTWWYARLTVRSHTPFRTPFEPAPSSLHLQTMTHISTPYQLALNTNYH